MDNRHIEFYFRFRFWRTCGHRHFHLPAKFGSNRMIGSEVMTYLFFKTAAIETEIYLRVQV